MWQARLSWRAVIGNSGSRPGNSALGHDHVPLKYDFQPFVLTKAQMDGAVEMLESFEFRSHVRRAPLVLGQYLDGAASADEPAAEVVEEALKVELSAFEGYDELERFVGQGPFAIFFEAAPARSDLFEDASRKAHVAIGTRVCEVPERNAYTLLSPDPSWRSFTTPSPPIGGFKSGLQRRSSTRCLLLTCCARSARPMPCGTWFKVIWR